MVARLICSPLSGCGSWRAPGCCVRRGSARPGRAARAAAGRTWRNGRDSRRAARTSRRQGCPRRAPRPRPSPGAPPSARRRPRGAPSHPAASATRAGPRSPAGGSGGWWSRPGRRGQAGRPSRRGTSCSSSCPAPSSAARGSPSSRPPSDSSLLGRTAEVRDDARPAVLVALPPRRPLGAEPLPTAVLDLDTGAGGGELDEADLDVGRLRRVDAEVPAVPEQARPLHLAHLAEDVLGTLAAALVDPPARPVLEDELAPGLAAQPVVARPPAVDPSRPGAERVLHRAVHLEGDLQRRGHRPPVVFSATRRKRVAMSHQTPRRYRSTASSPAVSR